GMPYTSQWTKGSAEGASGSSHTTTNERVSAGTSRHARSGGTPSPSTVQRFGSCPWLENDALETDSRLSPARNRRCAASLSAPAPDASPVFPVDSRVWCAVPMTIPRGTTLQRTCLAQGSSGPVRKHRQRRANALFDIAQSARLGAARGLIQIRAEPREIHEV